MKSFKELYQEIHKNEALQYIPGIVQRMNAGEQPRSLTTTSAPVFIGDDDRTRAQIRRNLTLISRKTGTDYTPIIAALKSDQHALGLLNQLLQELMGMGSGAGKTLAGRMV